jgi:hypothetical protein
MKLKDFLSEDDSIIMKIALYNLFSDIGDRCYASICGGFIPGVYEWASHNIADINEVENKKYMGYVITFGLASTREKQAYIPKWVLEVEVEGFDHAKNVFNKYIRRTNK